MIKKRKAASEFGSFSLIILGIVFIILGIGILFQLFGIVDILPSEKPAASDFLDAEVYPSKSVIGTVFNIRAEIFAEDVYSVYAIIKNRTFYLYDNGLGNDKIANDKIYSGIFDSIFLLENKNLGDIEGKVYALGADKTYTGNLYFNIYEDSCLSLLYNGNASDKIDLSVIGLEYDNLEDFNNDAKKYIDLRSENSGIFSYSPFKENIDRFNVNLIQEKYSLLDLGCVIGCNGVDSMVCCDDLKVSNVGAACSADNIILLINRKDFCGSSSLYSKTCAGGYNSPMVLVHEMGHSFANLGDEYNYDIYPNMEKITINFPNCVDDCSKWPSDLNEGCYKTCGYPDYYRYTENNCIMNSYVDNFCEVCSRNIEEVINNYNRNDIAESPAPLPRQMIFEMNYDNKEISSKEIYLSPGRASDMDSGEYTAEIVDLNDTVLYSKRFNFPIYDFPFYSNNSIEKPHLIVRENISYALTLPYFDDAKEIRVYDGKREFLLGMAVLDISSTCGDGKCEYLENNDNCNRDCNITEDKTCIPFKDGVCDSDCPKNTDSDCKKSKIYFYMIIFLVILGIVLFLSFWKRRN